MRVESTWTTLPPGADQQGHRLGGTMIITAEAAEPTAEQAPASGADPTVQRARLDLQHRLGATVGEEEGLVKIDAPVVQAAEGCASPREGLSQ